MPPKKQSSTKKSTVTDLTSSEELPEITTLLEIALAVGTKVDIYTLINNHITHLETPVWDDYKIEKS